METLISLTRNMLSGGLGSQIAVSTCYRNRMRARGLKYEDYERTANGVRLAMMGVRKEYIADAIIERSVGEFGEDIL